MKNQLKILTCFGVWCCLVCLVLGGAYFNKCYCPGVDPLLSTDAPLRKKMYTLKTTYTNGLNVTDTRVIPATGVPPANVLTMMFPNLDNTSFSSMTLAQYNATFIAVQNAIQQRLQNLNASAIDKNTPAPTLRIASGPNKILGFYMPTVQSANMSLYLDNYTALLTPEYVAYGVYPVDGTLNTAQTCNCGPPTFKCRKFVRYAVSFVPGMDDPRSSNFMALKSEFESKVDDIYAKNNLMLTNGGYGGAVALGIKLFSQGTSTSTSTAVGKKRKKRQADTTTTVATTTTAATNVTTTTAASNVTTTTLPTTTTATTTTTPAPRNDIVIVDTEIIMAGSDTPANMLKYIDSTLNTGKTGTNILSATNCAASTCMTDTLPNIKPPSFLAQMATAGTAIAGGFFVSYNCSSSNAPMIPFTSDLDSNFQIEVYCFNGNFQPPGWPSACQSLAVCPPLPTPPSYLFRVDTRPQFRVGESAYFACKDPNAVLDDGSGLRVLTVPCPSTQVYNITWPSCFVEPFCNSFPSPPSSTGLALSTTTPTVLLGNFINYDCIRKAEFYETPVGATFQILCDVSPTSNTVAVATTPNPWPICSKLPCVCLGYGLTVNQTLNILQSSCPSNLTYTMNIDTAGVSYILPRIVNCGSYHPNYPDFVDMCECPELGTPVTYWNQMQFLSFTWVDKMSDASQSIFLRRKQFAEQALDSYYLNLPWMAASGYLRSIVVYFKSGSARADNPDQSYVKATVLHLFRNDTNMTMDTFISLHNNMMSKTHGIFNPNFTLVPATTISSNLNCANSSLSRFFVSKFNVTGANKNIGIGNSVYVKCGRSLQFFTDDIWDSNSTDNTLQIICKPDQNFNVPSQQQMPDCLAKCAAVKPVPPARFNLFLDTTVTSPTNELWQNQYLTYKCNRSLDGVAIPGPNNTLEGSDSRTISYVCDPNGNYAIPQANNLPAFPPCLPRPRRCQCLGSFSSANFSKVALDLYCRNQTFQKLPSTVQDLSMNYLYQVVPNKTRCGSLDPVEMYNVENRCFCLTKENAGAKVAYWLRLEILNIPWMDEFLDLNSTNFTNAKLTIEEALDNMYIFTSDTFASGFVRTIVMRLFKGTTLLNTNWANLIKSAANSTNSTIPPATLDEIPDDFLPGDSIIPDFNPFPDAGPKSGFSKTNFYSTIADVEIQFADPTLATDQEQLTQLTRDTLLIKGWAFNTLWINIQCFFVTPIICGFRSAGKCDNSNLKPVLGFGMTHSAMSPTGDNSLITPDTLVGSTVNIYCADKQKRVTIDNADDDPSDFLLTVLCRPSGGFVLPLDSNNKMPPCKAWCNATKPVPTNDSGLIIHPKDNNTREYWEGEQLSFICIDPTLGVEASDSIFQNFTCIYDLLHGNRYTTPLLKGERWPNCLIRTTTIQPPIIKAFKTVFGQYKSALITQQNNLKQSLLQSMGDQNYYVLVTLPTLIFMSIIIMICLCCTRSDNSLWIYCSGGSDGK